MKYVRTAKFICVGCGMKDGIWVYITKASLITDQYLKGGFCVKKVKSKSIKIFQLLRSPVAVF